MPDAVPIAKLLGAVVQTMEAHLLRRLAAAGYDDVRPAHFAIFRHMEPDGLRLTDLAEKAHMTKQAAGELVTHLEDRGYLTRTSDATDGRVKIIRLTPAGEAARAAAARAFAAIEAAWADRVGSERIAELRTTLSLIAGLDVEPPG